MDRVGDLVLFMRVLDQGSISAAARSLDLSVAVASQRLKRLEQEVATKDRMAALGRLSSAIAEEARKAFDMGKGPLVRVQLFRLEPDGKEAARVSVRLGRASVNTIEIVDGLKPGDQVILSDMSQQDQSSRIRLN